MGGSPDRLRAMLWRGANHALPTAVVVIILNAMVMLLAVGAALVYSASVRPGVSDIQEMVDMLLEDFAVAYYCYLILLILNY